MSLTPEQITAMRTKYGIPEQGYGTSTTTSSSATAIPSADARIAKLRAAADAQRQVEEAKKPKLGQGAAGDFSGNVVRAIVSPLVRTGGMIESGLDQTLGRGINILKGNGNVPTTTGQQAQQTAQSIDDNANDTTAGKVGTFVGETIPYLLPMGEAAAAEKAVTKASQVLPGVLGAGARILGKAGVQGALAGATKLAQTGDVNAAGETALTAGILRGGFATIGEGLNAIHLPEKLYTTIFKNSKADMMSELNADGIASMQKDNPQVFADLVKQGIIKTTADGSPVVNKTLAEKALEHGLTGDIRGMANTVVKGKYESESAARALASNYTKPIDLSAPQYEHVLRDVADEYKNVGFGEIETEAKQLADVLKEKNGMVDADTALAVRRFLDRMRFASSYDKPVSKLSLTQANFKTLADAARGKINSIPGMSEVMGKYSFYIDALDALAQEAKRTGNNQVLSLIDSILLSGGGPAAGGVMAATRRILGMPGLKTNAAQAIENGVAPIVPALTNAAVSGGQSALSQ